MKLAPSRLFLAFAILSSCAALTSCGKAGSVTGAPENWVVAAETLNASNEPATTFPTGETVKIKISIQNDSPSVQILTFTSTDNFEFIIRGPSPATSEVWRWSNSGTYETGNISLLFDANETQTFTTLWDQKNASNVQVDVGDYQVRGIVLNGSAINVDDSDNLTASPVTVTIE